MVETTQSFFLPSQLGFPKHIHQNPPQLMGAGKKTCFHWFCTQASPMSSCCIGISTRGLLAAYSVAWEVFSLKGGFSRFPQKPHFTTAPPMQASSPSSPSRWSATWWSASPSTHCPSQTWPGSPLSPPSAGLLPCLPAFLTYFSPSTQATACIYQVFLLLSY